MDISLQYMDGDFNDFVTLSSTADLKDRDTLKIVYVPAIVLTPIDNLELPIEDGTVLPGSENYDTSVPSTPSSSSSVQSDDTVILNSCTPGVHKPWPCDFPIPTFSYNTEIALQKGNEAYSRDGSLLCGELSYPGVKSNILECLADQIFSYTPYPNDTQRCAVAEALTKKHPCLKEPGSFSGLYGWQQSLKYKVGNYRSKLRRHGISEVIVNSLKHKTADEKKPAKNIKKARKAEVNYLPSHSAGETEDSLESNRMELITEVKKKNNGRLISEMMSRTFSLRRQEIVGQAPSIPVLLERWPALFQPSQIREEFMRLNSKPLECTFMSQLDRLSTKMLELFNAKGGAAGQRIKAQLITLIQDPSASVEKRREVVLRCLIEYIGESQGDLISDHYVCVRI